MPASEIIVETQRIGASLRVAAVDVATGTEVVFQAPATASRASIDRLAASKLRYVLNKERDAQGVAVCVSQERTALWRRAFSGRRRLCTPSVSARHCGAPSTPSPSSVILTVAVAMRPVTQFQRVRRATRGGEKVNVDGRR